ncbi:MAG: Gfo/Idh/MocA family oxidoreductase, partial [Spirulinaceae cyanobacterium]
TECVALCRLAEEQHKQLLVDHTYLFNPAVRKGKEVIITERLGALRYGYASRTHLGPVRQDIDALWDLAIHDIAIFNYWLGEQPMQVQGNGSVWLQQGVADLVWLTLIYPSGFRAYIHLCWLNADKQRRLGVVGEKGSLIFDEMLTDTPLTLQQGYFEQQDSYYLPTAQHREVIPVPTSEPLKEVCDRFLENIRLGTSCSVSSGWVGAELVQVLCCLRESLKRRGEVIVVPNISQKT